jgi:hypothetical protein
MNPVAAVDQDDMVADHNVAVSRGRRRETDIEIVRHRPNRMPHIARKYESLADVRFPFSMPVPAFIVSESLVMVSVPIAGLLAIVVVEAVMFVMISVVVMIPVIVVVTVLITLIAVVPIVLILRLS